MRRYNETAPIPYVLRSPDQFAAFFTGLALVEPGLVPPTSWRPTTPSNEQGAGLCGVARKP